MSRSDYMREWSKRPKSKAYISAKMRKYRTQDDVRKREKEYLSQYQQRPDVREKRRIANRKRKLSPEYKARAAILRRKNKLRNNIGSSISQALKGVKNRRSWLSLLPFTLGELRIHLERQFTSRMNWENYGSYWHVDHIIPVSSFTFEKPEDPDFQRCWSLSNLRPLEASENMRKSSKRTLLI